MSRTAWSRTSSVPSDRIAPANATKPNRKGKAKVNDPPKSPEVLKLEGYVEGLKASSSVKDPAGGCFCQARVHPLSKYTPMCMQCGLVLCALHAPHYSCPHCSLPLLDASSRDSLISKLTVEISDLVGREKEQCEREEQERREAVGAFPTLSTSRHSQTSTPSPPRKVLSLNSQTKKVTVASYNPTPATVHSSSKVGESEPAVKRTPPPPKEVHHVRGKAAEGTRWENLRSERIYYVPPPNQNAAESSGKRRRKKNGVEAS